MTFHDDLGIAYSGSGNNLRLIADLSRRSFAYVSVLDRGKMRKGILAQ